MKANIRRIVMLCTVVILGSILIFIDVTLIQLLLILIAAALVLPFLLGIVTVAEVRTYLADLKKTGFLKRLDEIKIFEKSTPAGAKKEGAKPEKTVKKETPKPGDKKSGFLAHLTSTFRSLGTILKARSKPAKKVDDINKMLDTTISEKVSKPAAPVPGAAGGAGTPDSSDPFLSLSGDEFDEGLLDGLDDDPSLASLSDDLSTGEPASDQPAPELLMPSFEEMDDSAAAAPADAGSGPEGLSGLDGGSELDSEFGDLDNLSLDDVELDEDMGDSMDSMSPDDGASQETDSSPASTTPPPAAPDPNVVKTAWIPSDAPGGMDTMEDQLGIQSDMASFAGGSGGSDEDLLSSIASDVKTVTKEKDLSLLRELKDFKAPASEIEDELNDMFQKMGGATKEKEKTSSSSEANK